jgi:ABC-type phosphate/phosphonate transport system substrate-binding protein
MYDLPELREATDALWSAIAVELSALGVSAPTALTRPDGPLLDHWRTPGLLFSQTCGFPYASFLRPDVTLLGAFDYETTYADDPGFYRTVLVARSSLDSFEGLRVAINNHDSLSGCVSLGCALLDRGVTTPPPYVMTGGHVLSLAAVQNGEADLASIDGLTWALVSDVRPAAIAGLTVVGHGPRTPCTPFITADTSAAPAIRSAIHTAVARLSAESPNVLRWLRIRGFVELTDDVYLPTVAMGERAAALVPVGED